jgi:hypothetical protein
MLRLVRLMMGMLKAAEWRGLLLFAAVLLVG